jgi:F0F1-type ATP synthase membrane subunit b/b'
MIPFLSPLILRLLGGRFEWLADIIAIAALIGAVWGLWSVGLHFHDRGLINRHEAVIKTEIIEVTSEASADADAEAAKYEKQFEQQQTQSKKEIEDAKRDNRSPFDTMFK